MQPEINSISINDQFWIQVSNTFTSFGFKGLPNDVHYTFSYHENSEDVNIHLTRNIGQPNEKPKIEIVKIKKKVFEKMAPYSMMNILGRMLKPIDLTPYLKKSSKVKCIPIEALETGDAAEMVQTQLINGFKPISKLEKKTRLKVKGDIGSTLQNLCHSNELLISLKDAGVNLKDVINSNSKGGIFISGSETRAIIKYKDTWLEYTHDASPFELLSAVVGEEWAKIITRYTKRALVKIRKATSYKETKDWNDPIILVANPEFEKAIDNLQKSQVH